jgi:hypothetical protein
MTANVPANANAPMTAPAPVTIVVAAPVTVTAPVTIVATMVVTATANTNANVVTSTFIYLNPTTTTIDTTTASKVIIVDNNALMVKPCFAIVNINPKTNKSTIIPDLICMPKSPSPRRKECPIKAAFKIVEVKFKSSDKINARII